MIGFHAISLLDKEWIDRHLRCEDSPSADFNFGNMYIWDEHYRQLVCDFGERTLTKVRLHGLPAFVYPVGCGPLRPAIDALREYAAAMNYDFLLRGITDRHKALLEEEFPERSCWSRSFPNASSSARRPSTPTISMRRRSSPPMPARRCTGRRTTATASRPSTTGPSSP